MPRNRAPAPRNRLKIEFDPETKQPFTVSYFCFTQPSAIMSAPVHRDSYRDTLDFDSQIEHFQPRHEISLFRGADFLFRGTPRNLIFDMPNLVGATF